MKRRLFKIGVQNQRKFLMAKPFCDVLTCVLFLTTSVQALGAGEDAYANEDGFYNHVDLEYESPSLEQQRAENVCNANIVCYNNGKCVLNTDGIYRCECRNGTSGDLCKDVDWCMNPYRCKGNDVSCIYDVVNEKAMCRCENDSKKYDPDEEQCRVPCNWKDQHCGEHGFCLKPDEVDTGFMFCACKEGSSGDRCEVIDQCQNGMVDCGTEAKCKLGGKGRAYCDCELGVESGFDYDNKTCRECECGDESYGCIWRNGTKWCTCGGWTWYFDGEKCDECGCGPKVRCKLEDGKKKCECPEHLKQREGVCTQTCNSTDQCQNGGTCQDELCQCPKGTSGVFCEKVDWCGNDDRDNSRCGWRFKGVDCVYDPLTTLGKCICQDKSRVYDAKEKRCRDPCSATKPCQHNGTCHQSICQCGKGLSGDLCQSVDWCHFACAEKSLGECVYIPETGKGKCVCKLPKYQYDENQEKCRECDCGDHGNCSLGNWYASHDCHCEPGYVEDSLTGKCEPCDCGEHGTCYSYNKRKKCVCNDGYNYFKDGVNDDCQRCDCGPDASYCYFNEDLDRMCHCRNNTVVKRGTCAKCQDECGIDKDMKCSFGEYGLDNKSCDCPKGYRFDGDICQDINECMEQTFDCPENTYCKNYPGTYVCLCRTGFVDVWYNEDQFDCVDIDECRDPSTCRFDSVQCVNTIGSFRCVCREGYRPGSDYDSGKYLPNYNWCYERQMSAWRKATIGVGVVFAVTVTALLCAIGYRKYKMGGC